MVVSLPDAASYNPLSSRHLRATSRSQAAELAANPDPTPCVPPTEFLGFQQCHRTVRVIPIHDCIMVHSASW